MRRIITAFYRAFRPTPVPLVPKDRDLVALSSWLTFFHSNHHESRFLPGWSRLPWPVQREAQSMTPFESVPTWGLLLNANAPKAEQKYLVSVYATYEKAVVCVVHMGMPILRIQTMLQNPVAVHVLPLDGGDTDYGGYPIARAEGLARLPKPHRDTILDLLRAVLASYSVKTR